MMDDINDKMEYYLSIGAIEFVGFDTDGEAIYQVNEIAKEVAPELWQSHQEFIDKNLLDLFEKGFLEVEYDENLEATFHLSEEGKRVAKEIGLIDPDFRDET